MKYVDRADRVSYSAFLSLSKASHPRCLRLRKLSCDPPAPKPIPKNAPDAGASMSFYEWLKGRIQLHGGPRSLALCMTILSTAVNGNAEANKRASPRPGDTKNVQFSPVTVAGRSCEALFCLILTRKTQAVAPPPFCRASTISPPLLFARGGLAQA